MTSDRQQLTEALLSHSSLTMQSLDFPYGEEGLALGRSCMSVLPTVYTHQGNSLWR